MKAVATPMPEYPQALIRAGIKGRVTIRFVIREDGTVADATSVEPAPPELVAIGLAAVSKWRFEPPMSGGRAISIPAVQHFVFDVK